MARIEIKNNELVIRMQGKRKLFAMKSELSIPLTSIIVATADTIAWKDLPNAFEKRQGANLPGLYFGGTFVQDGDKVFYDLSRKEDALIITLKDEEFKHLIIGVEDPATTAELIVKSLK